MTNRQTFKDVIEFEAHRANLSLISQIERCCINAALDWVHLDADERIRIWPKLSDHNKRRLLTGMILRRDYQLGKRRIYDA